MIDVNKVKRDLVITIDPCTVYITTDMEGYPGVW